MKVLVTGGTGFAGSHTVAELLRSGHDVRLLVRSFDRITPALRPLGVGDVDAVLGDVTDPESVERAMLGCDAVVNCAAVYSLDPRMAETIRNTNKRGAEVVLGTACRLGLDPIVHVSSYAALFSKRGATVNPDSPLTEAKEPYFRSKADSDQVARNYQEQGFPVVITYPGAIGGPHDPHFGETCQMISNALKGFYVISPAGGLPLSDVRDLARLHSVLIEKGRGPRRYAATVRNVSSRELLACFATLTGRRLPTLNVPYRALLPPVKLLEAIQPALPFRLPFSIQMVYGIGLDNRQDDLLTQKEFNIKPLEMEKTIADTIKWMVQTRRLSEKLAGALGG